MYINLKTIQNKKIAEEHASFIIKLIEDKTIPCFICDKGIKTCMKMTDMSRKKREGRDLKFILHTG